MYCNLYFQNGKKTGIFNTDQLLQRKYFSCKNKKHDLFHCDFTVLKFMPVFEDLSSFSPLQKLIGLSNHG